MSIAPESLQVAEALKEDFPFFASQILRIGTTKGGFVPFKPNRAQIHAHKLMMQQKAELGFIRVIFLKARRLGMSTLAGGFGYQQTIHHKGFNAHVMAHDSATSQTLFEMAEGFYFNAPEQHRPHLGTCNRKELEFDALGSKYKVSTAGNVTAGRGLTIHFLHASEVAFWANGGELALGIMTAISDVPNTSSIIESTANGEGNFFHSLWRQAESGKTNYLPIFLPWFWDENSVAPVDKDFEVSDEEEDIQEQFGLSLEQIYWRRKKIAFFETNQLRNGEKAFKQEFPSFASEAFQSSGEGSYIPAEWVIRARKHTDIQPSGPLIIGLDPAATEGLKEGDSTAICWRRGSLIEKVKYYKIGDTMHMVGIMVNIIQEDKPIRVFVDVGGIGRGMCDRLIEMFGSELIRPINFGSQDSVLNRDAFRYKRDEMYGLFKEWLRQEDAQIPDDERLHGDIVSVTVKEYGSSGKLQLQSKKEIRGRNLPSPDGADACVLTFAEPVYQMEHNLEIADYGYR